MKEHFGSFENQKPEYAKLVAYLNIDSGTGRARGAGVFGPPSAAAIVRQALAPFEDLGVVGAVATTSRNVGGTDSTAFNNAGLPGIGFGQDPIEYGTHTHHTNLDTYERIIEERRQGVGDRDRGHAVPARDARRDAAALPAGADAAAAARAFVGAMTTSATQNSQNAGSAGFRPADGRRALAQRDARGGPQGLRYVREAVFCGFRGSALIVVD